MSSIATMTIDSKVVVPINFSTDSFRTFSSAAEVSVSSIKAATATFEIDLEEETDSEAFFAAWFLDKSKKDASIDINSIGNTSKFLTITCLDAQVVHYNVITDQRIDSNKQNGTVIIQIACLSITIGPSPLTLDF